MPLLLQNEGAKWSWSNLRIINRHRLQSGWVICEPPLRAHTNAYQSGTRHQRKEKLYGYIIGGGSFFFFFLVTIDCRCCGTRQAKVESGNVSTTQANHAKRKRPCMGGELKNKNRKRSTERWLLKLSWRGLGYWGKLSCIVSGWLLTGGRILRFFTGYFARILINLESMFVHTKGRTMRDRLVSSAEQCLPTSRNWPTWIMSRARSSPVSDAFVK